MNKKKANKQVFLSYFGRISEKIANILPHHVGSISFKAPPNLIHLLVYTSNKDETRSSLCVNMHEM